jgi:hypothetical protein
MKLPDKYFLFADKFIDKMAHYYIQLIVFIHILYVAIFFGLVSFNPLYLKWLNIGIQLFISSFLMIRFFPLRKNHTLKEHDPNIIFGCAAFLLFNLGFIEIISKRLIKQI